VSQLVQCVSIHPGQVTQSVRNRQSGHEAQTEVKICSKWQWAGRVRSGTLQKLRLYTTQFCVEIPTSN